MLLMEHIKDSDSSIVFLSQTWLSSQKSSVTAKFKDYGYKLYHKIRKNRTKDGGGGVGILAKLTLKIKPIDSKPFESFEHNSIRIETNSAGWITMISVYRLDYVPSTTFFREFSELLEHLSVQKDRFIIAGDINVHCDDINDTNTKRLNELLILFNLKQIIDKPTHIHGHTLDVVILQDTDASSATFEVNDISLSDHFLINFQTKYTTSKVLYKDMTYRKISQIDMTRFRIDVERALTSVTFIYYLLPGPCFENWHN